MNIKYLVFFSLVFFKTTSCLSQTTLISDSFPNRTKFLDNTLNTIFGANSIATTGFSLATKTDGNGLTFNAMSATTDAIANNGYVATNSLKTLTSIDYELNQTIDRLTNDITIEFDAIWNVQGSSGENGRLVVTLLDALPMGGGLPGQINNTSLADPFGKPIYNLRIRNNSTTGNGSMLLYGAGTNPNPGWEIYNDIPSGNNWWLPGFSVQAGGGSPGSGVNYPVTGTFKSSAVITSTTIWKHYTYKIMAERMELYQRNSNQTEASNSLVMFMQIPQNINNTYVLNAINTAHGTSATVMPPNYQWFRYTNAVRFYWRAGDNTFLSNITIKKTIITLPLKNITLFDATKKSGFNNEIKATYNNQDIKKLTLEHSTNGINFAEIKNFDIAQSSYLYNHIIDNNSTNYYRLKLFAKDGTISYSEIKKITNTVNDFNVFSKNNIVVVNTKKIAPFKNMITIFNVNGKKIGQYILENLTTEIKINNNTKIIFYTIQNEKEILTQGKLVVE
jgi:hypothetical protein